MAIELNDLKLQLNPQDIIDIMFDFFQVDTYLEKDSVIIFPTICHNKNANSASLKLYYYKDSHKFHCYTECGDTFDIFDLIERRYKLLNKPYNFILDAYYPIADRIDFQTTTGDIYQPVYEQYLRKEQKTVLKVRNPNVLAAFSNYYTPQWIKEGISVKTMKEFNIKFAPVENKIVIPHYNIDNELIGVRARALNEEDIIQFGKYGPMRIQGIWYSHPLSLNLYGLNKNKQNIQKIQKAIVFESEKSVMLYHEHYPKDNIAVAVCGSSFNKIQLTLLLELGVNEIIIAFDKEYQEYPSKESDKYFYKLLALCKKYQNYIDMSFIFDTRNLLGYKDSPIDINKAVFEQLIKERVKE